MKIPEGHREVALPAVLSASWAASLIGTYACAAIMASDLAVGDSSTECNDNPQDCQTGELPKWRMNWVPLRSLSSLSFRRWRKCCSLFYITTYSLLLSGTNSSVCNIYEQQALIELYTDINWMKPQVFSKSVLIVQKHIARLIWKCQPKAEDVKMPDRVDCSSVLWYPNHNKSMMATIRTLLSSLFILQRQISLAFTRSQDTRWSFFGFTQPRKVLFRRVREMYCLRVQGNSTEFRWVQK